MRKYIIKKKYRGETFILCSTRQFFNEKEVGYGKKGKAYRVDEKVAKYLLTKHKDSIMELSK